MHRLSYSLPTHYATKYRPLSTSSLGPTQHRAGWGQAPRSAPGGERGITPPAARQNRTALATDSRLGLRPQQTCANSPFTTVPQGLSPHVPDIPYKVYDIQSPSLRLYFRSLFSNACFPPSNIWQTALLISGSSNAPEV